MCIIVDANVAGRLVGAQRNSVDARVADWLANKKGKIVVGGRLSLELVKIGEFRKFLAVLERGARVREIPNDLVIEETNRIAADPELKSDDPHVIALAKLSGSRVLCSDDKALRKDFRNGHFLSSSRGKICSTEKSFDELVGPKTCP